MILNNLNCKYLEVKSSVYDSLMAATKLASVTIKGKINDGSFVEKTIYFPVVQREYFITLPISEDKSLTEFNVKNLFTGQVYDLLDYSMTINTPAEVAEFKNIITSKFTSLFGKHVQQNTTINYDGTTPVSFLYKIKALPYYIVPTTMTIRHDNVLYSEDFQVSANDEGIAFAVDKFILTPTFFNIGQFTDSIISLTVTFRTVNKESTTEQTCYFMDCTFKCKLPTITNFHCLDDSVKLTMLHYSLKQASNCDCDCNSMYIVFQYLQKQIGNLTQNIEDCGCN